MINIDLDLKIDYKENLKEYNKTVKELQKLASKKAVVKFDESKTYEDGTKVETVAFFMEYGSDEFKVHYPARPFWRTALKQYEPQLQKRFEYNIKSIVEGKLTAESCFDDLAKQLIVYIRKSIASGNFTPLTASTVEKRLRAGKDTKPLIDTSLMYNSLTYEVI